MIARVETFTSRRLRTRYFFAVVASNGEILAASEGYSRKIDRDATAAVFAKAFGAPMIERT